MKDYHKTLGISVDATPEEIKRTYRKLARKTHPDLATGPDPEAQFKDINAVYDVLKTLKSAQNAMKCAVAAGNVQSRLKTGTPAFHFLKAAPTRTTILAMSSPPFFWRRRKVWTRRPDGRRCPCQIALDTENAYRGSVRTRSLPIRSIDHDGRATMTPKDLSVRIPADITGDQTN